MKVYHITGTAHHDDGGAPQEFDHYFSTKAQALKEAKNAKSSLKERGVTRYTIDVTQLEAKSMTSDRVAAMLNHDNAWPDHRSVILSFGGNV